MKFSFEDKLIYYFAYDYLENYITVILYSVLQQHTFPVCNWHVIKQIYQMLFILSVRSRGHRKSSTNNVDDEIWKLHRIIT